MPPFRVLLLGGTGEGAEIARRLAPRTDIEVVVSLAGRTSRPAPLPGTVRVGGFGGPDGLTRFLADEHISAVIDATHPFAAEMPHHAARACATAGVARVRLLRPPWEPVPGDRWHPVRDLTAVPAALAALGARRVFLTTGRTDLAPFAPLVDTWFLIRSVDAPDPLPLARAEALVDRGPFDEESELALLDRHDIDVLVTRNSGGAASAKLAAARTRRIPVVIIDRPPAPEGPAVSSVGDALEWLIREGG